MSSLISQAKSKFLEKKTTLFSSSSKTVLVSIGFCSKGIFSSVHLFYRILNLEVRSNQRIFCKFQCIAMGALMTVLASRAVWISNSSTLETPPIVFTRSTDFTVSGNPKPELKETWELAMRSMIGVDLQTRKLLMPIIEDRMDRMNYKNQYKQDKISSVLKKFSNWNEREIFELHDLFQLFETEGDGLINVTEMIFGLENFNDKTPLKVRVDTICHYDDGSGHMKFENFLKMIQMLESEENKDNPLRHTFENLQETIRFLRHMSVPQQLLSGFL